MTLSMSQATRCTVSVDQGRTQVANSASSWRAGRARITVRESGKDVAFGDVQPGSTAFVSGEFGSLTRRMSVPEERPTERGPAGDPAGRAAPRPGAAAAAGGVGPPGGRDWDSMCTKAGTVLFPSSPVVVDAFDVQLDAPDPGVLLSLRNEGTPWDVLPIEVEFAYSPSDGEITPYSREVEVLTIEGFAAGTTLTRRIALPRSGRERPLFARIVAFAPDDISATAAREVIGDRIRPGTRLLGGRVEVVGIGGDLSATTPTLSFVLENVGTESSESAVGRVRYLVQFYKAGKLVDMGRRFSTLRPIGGSLDERGARVKFDVTGLEKRHLSVAGSRPVLRLVRDD
jgi:hypothetical protein